MDIKWYVTLSHESPEHQDVHTFAWGDTQAEAERRLNASMKDMPDVWAGWSYTFTGESAV